MKTNQVKSIATLIVSTVLTTAGWAQTNFSQTLVKISVAANRLDKALATLASQTARPIDYDPKVAQMFHSPAVNGTLTPANALILLVKGTGLEAHIGSSFAVNQSDQETISLKATRLRANLEQAVKSHKIPQKAANQLYDQLSQVRSSVVELAKEQGFVSAAEKASYHRTFDQAEQLLAVSK